MMPSDPQGARALGASAQGAHSGGRAINQDAFATRATGARATVAVADGHGSPTCFRSEIGARIAIEVALELDELLLTDLGALEDEAAQAVFARRLIARWREHVLAHLGEHPFDDRDLPVGLRGVLLRAPSVVYGSTLILVTADDTRVAYVQIGDGEAIAVSGDATARTIFAKAPELHANETHSLCEDEAWEHVRIDVQRRESDDPAYVLVATDGFINAFASSQAARERASELVRSLTESDDLLRDGLDAIARDAMRRSGDDTTLTILIPPSMRADAYEVLELSPSARASAKRVGCSLPLVAAGTAFVLALAAAMFSLRAAHF